MTFRRFQQYSYYVNPYPCLSLWPLHFWKVLFLRLVYAIGLQVQMTFLTSYLTSCVFLTIRSNSSIRALTCPTSLNALGFEKGEKNENTFLMGLLVMICLHIALAALTSRKSCSFSSAQLSAQVPNVVRNW